MDGKYTEDNWWKYLNRCGTQELAQIVQRARVAERVVEQVAEQLDLEGSVLRNLALDQVQTTE